MKNDLKQDFFELNNRFWGVSIPSVLAQLSGLLGLTISLFFIATLKDPLKTGAVGLGVSLMTMLCEAPVTGMNSGIGVLVSIAYG
jgi:Na+-driven multidrug efflux pump